VVLLIACANVASLLLVRGAARAGELALRHALGATRRRLLGLLLAEAVLLATAGGVVGLLVARLTLRGIVALVPEQLSDVVAASLDARMLVLSAVLALGTGLASGSPGVPRRAPRPSQHDAATAGQVAGGTRGAGRARTLLVGGQIALAMTLLVSASLAVRSLVNITREPLGSSPTGWSRSASRPAATGTTGAGRPRCSPRSNATCSRAPP
jgi:hypothetical protein